MARTRLIDVTLSTYELRIVRDVLKHEVETSDEQPGAKFRALDKIDVALQTAAA